MSKNLEEYLEQVDKADKGHDDHRRVATEAIKEALRVAEEWCNEAYTKDSHGVFLGLKKETLTAGALLAYLKQWAGE